MDDFPVFLLFLIFYIVSVLTGNKKKKQKKSPVRKGAQGEQMDMRTAKRNRQTAAGFDESFSQQQYVNGQDTCGVTRIHLHEVEQTQFAHASEGEDPCHVGGNASQESVFLDLQREETETDLLAQDVLRGMIMSEILTRPHERTAMRRGRR